MSDDNEKPSFDNEPQGDYDVGYKKPSKHTRFKPGQSGNPKGRAKGAKGLKTDLREEMSERVEITENGKKKKISKQRLMIKALAQKAAKGDVKAASQLVSLTIQSFGLEDCREGKSQLSKHDAALVADLEAHLVSDDDTKPVTDGAGDGDDNGDSREISNADDEEPNDGDDE